MTEEQRQTYTLDEYINELTSFIGPDNIAEFDALPDWSDERFHSLTTYARMHGGVAFNQGYSYQYITAIEGLSWSLGRLNMFALAQVRAMKTNQLISLLHAISENCLVQGEVPHFVNNHFRENTDHV
jgi:hypothetical protein